MHWMINACALGIVYITIICSRQTAAGTV